MRRALNVRFRSPAISLGIRIRIRITVALALAFLMGSSRSGEPDQENKEDGGFSITTPVVCKNIEGYEDYEELPGAELTSEDKLLIYFRPRHFKISPAGAKFEAHFTQEGKIRRRGEKAVVWQKAKLLDYTAKADTTEMPVFLKNTISMKTLKPGDYQFEIILRDEIGKSAPASRTVFFKIIPKKAEALPLIRTDK